MQDREQARHALQELATRRHADLVRIAARILKDDAEAEDVVQETFARLWLKWQAGTLEKPEAYLFRAVHINALKRRARRRMHASIDADPELEPAARPDGAEDSPGRSMTLEIDPLTLERALDGLPETQKAVIRMKYYVGLSFREIGDALAISSNTAASRCRYALDSLRKILKGTQDDERK